MSRCEHPVLATRRAPQDRAAGDGRPLDLLAEQPVAVVVERVARLVQQQHARLVQERHRQADALALAHRHAVDAPLGELLQAEPLQADVDQLAPALAGHVGEPRPVVELLADAHARLQAAVARREEADLPPVAVPPRLRRELAHAHAAALRQQDAGGEAQQRGLAHAVAPADPGHLARAQRQADVVEHGRLRSLPAVVEVLELERGCSRHVCDCPAGSGRGCGSGAQWAHRARLQPFARHIRLLFARLPSRSASVEDVRGGRPRSAVESPTAQSWRPARSRARSAFAGARGSWGSPSASPSTGRVDHRSSPETCAARAAVKHHQRLQRERLLVHWNGDPSLLSE